MALHSGFYTYEELEGVREMALVPSPGEAYPGRVQYVAAPRVRYVSPKIIESPGGAVISYEPQEEVMQVSVPHRRSAYQTIQNSPINAEAQEEVRVIVDSPVSRMPVQQVVVTPRRAPGRVVQAIERVPVLETQDLDKEAGEYVVVKPRFTHYQKTLAPKDELTHVREYQGNRVFAVTEEIPVEPYVFEHRALRKNGVLVHCPRVDPEIENKDKEVHIINRSRGYELRQTQRLLDDSAPVEAPIIEARQPRRTGPQQPLSPTVKLIRK